MNWPMVAVLLVGILVGYGIKTVRGSSKASGRRHAERERNRAERSLKPYCMCDHHFGDHENGGKCKNNYFDFWDTRIKCSCTVYVGPDPMLSAMYVGNPNNTKKE